MLLLLAICTVAVYIFTLGGGRGGRPDSESFQATQGKSCCTDSNSTYNSTNNDRRGRLRREHRAPHRRCCCCHSRAQVCGRCRPPTLGRSCEVFTVDPEYQGDQEAGEMPTAVYANFLSSQTYWIKYIVREVGVGIRVCVPPAWSFFVLLFA